MKNSNKSPREDLIERNINWAISHFKYNFYLLTFMVVVIVPILTISEIREGNFPLPIFIFTVWAYIFYKLSNLLNNKEIVSFWVSLPSIALVIFASLFY